MTTTITTETYIVRARRLSLTRCAASGAAVLAVLFIVCWAAAAAGYAGASHKYITLFTAAPEASLAALGIGLCWSVVFGAATGVLVALAYNAFAFMERR